MNICNLYSLGVQVQLHCNVIEGGGERAWSILEFDERLERSCAVNPESA